MISNFLSDVDQKALYEKNMEHFKGSASDEEKLSIRNGTSSSIAGHLTEKVFHITSNIWPRKGSHRHIRKKAARSFTHGVEIRTLDSAHFLAGQRGLFAAQPFQIFDVVGEYCGEVVPPVVAGKEYTANLEENKSYLLGVDAQYYGNEMRTINHYEHIADAPNVLMKICYVEELPRVIIICTRDIATGEEFLLDYGEHYVKDHLRENETKVETPVDVDWSELAGDVAVME